MGFAEIVFVATAYSWGCGAGELSRIERPALPMFTVAVDPTIIRLGVALEIDALPGRTFRAEDTGPDIVGNRIDIMVGTCEEAREWGRKQVRIKVRKDLEWHNRLSKPHALLAERLVSIRGSANLRARQSSVSSAEAQAVRRFVSSRSRAASVSGASRPYGIHAVHSSLLAWAARELP
jgi:3D (Asp-Asp-Asp) domain-containing protein